MARIISEANAGMVAPPEQVEPLVKCVLSLADDALLAREMGANGRRLCEREFGWRKLVEAWLARILGNRTKRESCDPVSSTGYASYGDS